MARAVWRLGTDPPQEVELLGLGSKHAGDRIGVLTRLTWPERRETNEVLLYSLGSFESLDEDALALLHACRTARLLADQTPGLLRAGESADAAPAGRE